MWRYLSSRKFGIVFVETLLLILCVLGAYYIRIGISHSPIINIIYCSRRF